MSKPNSFSWKTMLGKKWTVWTLPKRIYFFKKSRLTMEAYDIIFIHVYVKPIFFFKKAVVTWNHHLISRFTSASDLLHGFSEPPLVPSLKAQHKGRILQILCCLYSSVFSNLRAFFMLSSTNRGKSYKNQHIIRIILIVIVYPQTLVFYFLFNRCCFLKLIN